MLSGEAVNTNVIVFSLTQQGLEPMIYCTWGEHASPMLFIGITIWKILSGRNGRSLMSRIIFFFNLIFTLGPANPCFKNSQQIIDSMKYFLTMYFLVPNNDPPWLVQPWTSVHPIGSTCNNQNKTNKRFIIYFLS